MRKESSASGFHDSVSLHKSMPSLRDDSSRMIPLEDNAGDVIGKAQRGLGISDSQLAERAGVSAEAVRQARDADADSAVLERLAPILQLDAAALIELANGSYRPREEKVDGLAMFNTPYGDMRVNAYLVWDPRSRAAVAFDSVADCGGMLQKIENDGLNVQLILLTHAHPDHVADLQRLHAATS